VYSTAPMPSTATGDEGQETTDTRTSATTSAAAEIPTWGAAGSPSVEADTEGIVWTEQKPVKLSQLPVLYAQLAKVRLGGETLCRRCQAACE